MMSAIPGPENPDGSRVTPTPKLMVSGFICAENPCVFSMEVTRGMPIRSKEGLQVGKVAAIVLDAEKQKATHLLLDRLPEMSGYWLVRAKWIRKVQDDEVWLSIPSEAIPSLPRWQST